MTLFHGYLYRWGIQSYATKSHGIENAWEAEFFRAGRFELITEYAVTEKRGAWKHYKYFSPEPLSPFHRLQRSEMGNQGPFPYEILVRVNILTGTIVFLSTGSKIVQHLVEKVLNYKVSPRLVRLQVKVAELTEHLIKEGINEYAMTSLRSRIVASGRNLEKVSFEGKDLANSPTVTNLFSLLTPHYVGMRRRCDPEDTEAIRLSNRGYIAISFGDVNESRYNDLGEASRPMSNNAPLELHVGRAESCLHYISEHGFYWS